MQGFLFQELSKTNRWRLVDQEQVVTVVHERAFQEAKTCSTACLGALGSRLGAQTLLLPDLSRQDGISRLSVREVSVATGEVLRSAQAETDEPLSSSSKRLAQLVVARLAGDPTVTATDSGAIQVIANAPARIWIDGEDAGDAPLTREVWPGVHRVSLEPQHSIPPARERPPPEPNFTVGAVFIFPLSSGGGYGRRGGYSQRPPAGAAFPRGSAPAPAGRGGSHSRGGGDGTAEIIAGTVVAAVGIGLMAEASSMPDSVWSDTWHDVQVKAADTVSVEFHKDSNGDKTAMTVMGILGIMLGIVLVAAVLVSKN